jgi:mRNA interferase YafQ
MLEPFYAKSFRKERELMRKRGLDVDKLLEVINMIVAEQPLPPERENHPLHGEWKDALGCHIQGDWVLIYQIDKAARKVTFHHTGSHSDLF